MGATDISVLSMFLFSSIILLPLVAGIFLKLGITKNLIYSLTRMSIQLLLVGVYLKYLFEYNNIFVNTAYIFIMIAVAAFSVIRSSSLSLAKTVFPVFWSIVIPQIVVLALFNWTTVGITELFNAKYLVPIGGMILGNCLSGNIITLSSFYKSINKDEKRFLQMISYGADKSEAIAPYLRASMLASINPALSRMATMGIVSLPGMMTGQILGGSVPMVAIKYQILIMIAIFSASFFSGLLSIYFTLPVSFTACGTLNKKILNLQSNSLAKGK
ncbi:MAG: ABC transporter permease [Spirochaetes bacterium]|nr:ABC transporter permease [Spirochaetota bacterium]MBN2771106.1 ABC transporter permease [Spirochaetota bacterium]